MAKEEKLSRDASAAACGVGMGGGNHFPSTGGVWNLPPLMKNYKGPEKGISFSVDLE